MVGGGWLQADLVNELRVTLGNRAAKRHTPPKPARASLAVAPPLPAINPPVAAAIPPSGAPCPDTDDDDGVVRCPFFTDHTVPLKPEAIIGNEVAVKKVIEWARARMRSPETSRSILVLIGPDGIGKTTCLHALAARMEWTITPISVADASSRSALASNVSLTSKTNSSNGRPPTLFVADNLAALGSKDIRVTEMAMTMMATSRSLLMGSFVCVWDGTDRSCPLPKLFGAKADIVIFRKPNRTVLSDFCMDFARRVGKEMPPAMIGRMIDQGDGLPRKTMLTIGAETLCQSSGSDLIIPTVFDGACIMFDSHGGIPAYVRLRAERACIMRAATRSAELASASAFNRSRYDTGHQFKAAMIVFGPGAVARADRCGLYRQTSYNKVAHITSLAEEARTATLRFFGSRNSRAACYLDAISAGATEAFSAAHRAPDLGAQLQIANVLRLWNTRPDDAHAFAKRAGERSDPIVKNLAAKLAPAVL